MSIQLHFTPKDWERVERDWTAWWAGELDRPMVVIGNLEFGGVVTVLEVGAWEDGAHGTALGMPAVRVLDFYQGWLENARFYGDSFPRWWPNFGPGIVAGFLGSQVNSVPGTVWFSPSERLPIEALRASYDPDNVWWRWVRELTRAAVERWGDAVLVAHTDLGGNLDILASLRDTQQLLFDLYDTPDEVSRLIGEITRQWLRYYQELFDIIKLAGRGTTAWAPMWSPGRYYMLQSDFCYMISPAMFERFVLPDLAACCDALDHAFYHLDGKGQIPHLDMLLALERLRGIQWIPGDGQPPPEEWLPLLKRIRDGGKLCQVYVTPAGARTIVRELGGRGFCLCINEPMSEDDAQGLLRLLAAEDANRPRS
jgi:5-methyltetrahydrofolate--homocysteine methyltransferase